MVQFKFVARPLGGVGFPLHGVCVCALCRSPNDRPVILQRRITHRHTSGPVRAGVLPQPPPLPRLHGLRHTRHIPAGSDAQAHINTTAATKMRPPPTGTESGKAHHICPALPNTPCCRQRPSCAVVHNGQCTNCPAKTLYASTELLGARRHRAPNIHTCLGCRVLLWLGPAPRARPLMVQHQQQTVHTCQCIHTPFQVMERGAAHTHARGKLKCRCRTCAHSVSARNRWQALEQEWKRLGMIPCPGPAESLCRKVHLQDTQLPT